MFALLIGPGVAYCLVGEASEQRTGPFVPGEKLTFVLKWGKIPAGKATLEVQAIEALNGETAYRFVMTARTNAFVDIFFKVRKRFFEHFIHIHREKLAGYLRTNKCIHKHIVFTNHIQSLYLILACNPDFFVKL